MHIAKPNPVEPAFAANNRALSQKYGSVAIRRFAILCIDGEELESDEADVASSGGEGLIALALSSGCNSAVCSLA